MSKLITFLLLLIAFNSYSQSLPVLPKGLPSPKTNGYEEKGWYRGDSGYLYGVRDTMFRPITGVGAEVFWNNEYWKWDLLGQKWKKGGGAIFASNGLNKDGDTLKIGGNVLDSAVIRMTNIGTGYALKSSFEQYGTMYPSKHELSIKPNGSNGAETRLYMDIWNALAYNTTNEELAGLAVGNETDKATARMQVSGLVNQSGIAVKDKNIEIRSDSITLNTYLVDIPQATSNYGILVRDSSNKQIKLLDPNDLLLKQSQNPTASISPSYRIQRRATDTILNFTYTYGRLAATSSAKATADIQSVVVDGVSRTFTNPAPGSTGAGGISVNYTPNSTRNIPITVTATDGKFATQSVSIQTTFTYYIGYSLTSTPTDAELFAGLNSFLATSNTRVTSGTLVSPPGARYIFFAFPASLGTANVIIGGTPVGYITTPRAVTNTTGFTESFNITVSPNATNSGVTYQIN